MRIHKKNQAGASLFEVLIALFILGVGLLGVISLQAESLKLNQQASSSTQALLLANDMAERIRLAKSTCDLNSTALGSCEDWNAVKAYINFDEWETAVKGALPGGAVAVTNLPTSATPPEPGEISIDIKYQQTKLDNEGAAVTADMKEVTYKLVTRI